MIVSHKHKFIFLHSRKTAGSSVTISLFRHLDPDDVYLCAPGTGVLRDALRLGIVPAPLLKADLPDPLAEKLRDDPKSLTRSERLAVIETFNAGAPRPPRTGWQHVHARTARKHIDAKTWNSYFKFSFERDPWDRMVSLYWWRVRLHDSPPFTFRQFITAMHSGDAREMRKALVRPYSNWPIYCIQDRPAVDHVGKYENLIDELQAIGAETGMPFDGWLPRSKGNVRRKVPLSEMYEQDTLEMVGEIFKREIALLGYEAPSLA